MLIKKSRSRILAVQSAFLFFTRGINDIEQLLSESIDFSDSTFQNQTSVDLHFCTELLKNFLENFEEIKRLIEESAPKFNFDSLSTIDKSILAISLSELIYYKKTPLKVVANEAVEIAKFFKDEAGAKFVNGTLGTIIEKMNLENGKS